ncbi:MAG: hypothetical protein OXN97_04120, partial [Bryobacterales bacterium]|nr:hypothetical protein [Bryobacterales bacterium]
MLEESNSSRNEASQPNWRGYAQLAFIVFAIAIALYFARAPGRVDRGAASDTTSEDARPTVRVIRPTLTEQSLTVTSVALKVVENKGLTRTVC